MRRSLLALARRFAAAREGTTAIEYSVIAAGVGIAILASVNTLGTDVMNIFYSKLSTLF